MDEKETPQEGQPEPEQVASTTPPQPKPGNSYKLIALVLGIILVFIIGASVYFFASRPSSSLDQTPTPQVTQAVSQVTVTPTSVPTSSPSSQTVVIIESESSLPPQDVSELRARVINPYLDYFKETRSDDSVVTFKVSKNTQASAATYPYLADAITKNGATEGFVIGRTEGHISWWIPDCLNGCTFSDAFKAKYPEVVAAYGN